MQLYGSTTSPFVRRLRLYLGDKDYEFINLDIFSAEGREILREKNPTLKIPMLQDGEQAIYDSRVIYRYLADKAGDLPLSWQQENAMTVIDAANDAFIILLMLKRSGVANDADFLLQKLTYERTASTLGSIADYLEQGLFANWDYPSICLFTLLDWIDFRGLYDLSTTPAFVEFHSKHKSTALAKATDPRV